MWTQITLSSFLCSASVITESENILKFAYTNLHSPSPIHLFYLDIWKKDLVPNVHHTGRWSCKAVYGQHVINAHLCFSSGMGIGCPFVCIYMPHWIHMGFGRPSKTRVSPDGFLFLGLIDLKKKIICFKYRFWIPTNMIRTCTRVLSSSKAGHNVEVLWTAAAIYDKNCCYKWT